MQEIVVFLCVYFKKQEIKEKSPCELCETIEWNLTEAAEHAR